MIPQLHSSHPHSRRLLTGGTRFDGKTKRMPPRKRQNTALSSEPGAQKQIGRPRFTAEGPRSPLVSHGHAIDLAVVTKCLSADWPKVKSHPDEPLADSFPTHQGVLYTTVAPKGGQKEGVVSRREILVRADACHAWRIP